MCVCVCVCQVEREIINKKVKIYPPFSCFKLKTPIFRGFFCLIHWIWLTISIYEESKNFISLLRIMTLTRYPFEKIHVYDADLCRWCSIMFSNKFYEIFLMFCVKFYITYFTYITKREDFFLYACQNQKESPKQSCHFTNEVPLVSKSLPYFYFLSSFSTRRDLYT